MHICRTHTYIYIYTWTLHVCENLAEAWRAKINFYICIYVVGFLAPYTCKSTLISTSQKLRKWSMTFSKSIFGGTRVYRWMHADWIFRMEGKVKKKCIVCDVVIKGVLRVYGVKRTTVVYTFLRTLYVYVIYMFIFFLLGLTRKTVGGKLEAVD